MTKRRFICKVSGLGSEGQLILLHFPLLAKLEELFFEGAFQRFSPITEKWWKFPLYFALQPEGVASEASALLGAVCKTFHLVNFGFFLLIGAACNLCYGHPRINSTKQVEAQLNFWSEKLGKDPSSCLNGSVSPSRVDFALFGQLQMIYSGLSEPLVVRIMCRPRLVAYMQHMNEHFRQHKFNIYTRRVENCTVLHDHPPGVKRSPPLHTLLTLSTLALLLTIGFPLLAVFLIHSLWIRSSNNHASGRKLDPECYWGRLLKVKRGKQQSRQAGSGQHSAIYTIVTRICAVISTGLLLKELVEFTSGHPGAFDYCSMLGTVLLAGVAVTPLSARQQPP
jgi:hypothetical protein